MKTLCYSVRLESLVRISDKAYKATSFDGSSDVIPASQVFGQDMEVQKCEAWWISAWILKKKDIQYTSKKQAWFETRTVNGKTDKTIIRDDVKITKHRPAPIDAVNNNIIESLKK